MAASFVVLHAYAQLIFASAVQKQVEGLLQDFILDRKAVSYDVRKISEYMRAA